MLGADPALDLIDPFYETVREKWKLADGKGTRPGYVKVPALVATKAGASFPSTTRPDWQTPKPWMKRSMLSQRSPPVDRTQKPSRATVEHSAPG